MKIYEKKYEDVFTSPKKMNRCKLDKITTVSGDSLEEYTNKFKQIGIEINKLTFNFIVKFAWLSTDFVYDGRVREKSFGNTFFVDAAYGIFIKQHVKTDFTQYSKTFVTSKVITYLNDFFPDFKKYSPFENPEKYEFPYKNIGCDYLTVVYQMDERLDLLKIAEKEKMSYIEFLDYVVNYVCCLNEEIGREKYIIKISTNYPVYAKKNEPKDKTKASYIFPRSN